MWHRWIRTDCSMRGARWCYIVTALSIMFLMLHFELWPLTTSGQPS